MTEYRLFEGDVPHVSTAEFHADRERAPHLEQGWHRPRLEHATEFVRLAAEDIGGDDVRISDLGCGDGGLLSLVQQLPGVGEAWGYDFCPANETGWEERHVEAYAVDVFRADGRSMVTMGDIVVMTEVLEHVADPHRALRWAREEGKRLVCSSPWSENLHTHSPEHAWAWDLEGYATMIQEAGWEILRHETVGIFQVVLAK